MSAFMLSDSSWLRVIDAIAKPNPYGHSVADELGKPWSTLARQWYRANDRAVSARYNHEEEAMPSELLPSAPVRDQLSFIKANGGRVGTIRPESLAWCVQAVKSLECLRYQCSEDVPAHLEESHKATLEEIGKAIGILAARAVHACAEYDKAAWG